MLPLKTNDVSADVVVFVRSDVADERVLTGVVTIFRDRIILHLSASLRTLTGLFIHTLIHALTNPFPSLSINHLSSHSLTHSLTSPTSSSNPNSYFLELNYCNMYSYCVCSSLLVLSVSNEVDARFKASHSRTVIFRLHVGCVAK
jgi:hypothetical protein